MWTAAPAGTPVDKGGSLANRLLPKITERRSETDDHLKIATEGAGKVIVGQPTLVLRLVEEIKRAIRERPDLEAGARGFAEYSMSARSTSMVH